MSELNYHQFNRKVILLWENYKFNIFIEIIEHTCHTNQCCKYPGHFNRNGKSAGKSNTKCILGIICKKDFAGFFFQFSYLIIY